MGSSNNFIDRIDVYVKSGDGGNGLVHFRHEKYLPKGGPDGGNGGKGGDIIFKINKKLSTLNNLRYIHHIIAKNGVNGGENDCTGKNAENIIIEVPEGTMIFDKNTREKLKDLINDEQYILKGGRGGLGNTNFKSPTNQTPRYAQDGEKGIEKELTLELSLLADVGFVGLPNAGKSTLLSILTNAKPEIGDYPFTTLSPQLGILKYKDNKECVIADLPGLIEKASLGKGLGLRFLQHIKRVNLIVFLIDINDNIEKTLKILQNELYSYDESLKDKKYIVCISKCDFDENEDNSDILENKDYIYISSFTKYGIDNLKNKIFTNL